MLRTIVALAVIGVAGPAAASDKTDVMAAVNQFMDGFNKWDTKSMVAACAEPASVVDDFPPHAWQGASACADWAKDFDAFCKQNAITSPNVVLAKPQHVDVTADRGYVVAPAKFNYKLKGKPTSEAGTFTVALQKGAAGWRITGWAWSKH